MSPIKLIAIDIDGTIYPYKGKLVDLDKAKNLQGLVRKVIEDTEATPILCTGKVYQYVEQAAEIYGFVDVPGDKPMTHICEAGAIIFTYNNWEDRNITKLGDVFGKFFIKDRLRHIKETISNYDIFAGVTEEVGRLESLSFNPPRGESVHPLYINILRVLEKDLDFKVLTAENSIILSDVVQVVANKLKTHNEAEVKRYLINNMDPFYDLFISKSSTAIDLSPFPTGKALGISYAAIKIHNIDPKNAIAIGDTPGDHSAFETVGIPIAVANAKEETKEHATSLGGFVTKKESIDGVCAVLEHLLKYPTVEEFRKKWK